MTSRRIPRIWLVRASVGSLALVFGLFGVSWWVVPAMISREIASRLGADAEFHGWWVDGRSAGVTGLVLREAGAGAPVFATADRVTTDLNLAMILRGRFTPTRMTVTRPKVLVRFGPGGEPLTKLRPVQQGGTFPVVIVETAQLTLAQTGRPAMVIENLLGRFGTDGRGLTFAARANDRDWGLLEATGGFSSDFTAGMLVLKTGSAGLSVTPEKVLAIPFVPSQVWENVAPTGDVDVRLTIETSEKAGNAPHVQTEISLRRASVVSPTLGLTATRTTGKVFVDGALVTLTGLSGRAVDGRVTARGGLDFGRSPAVIDVTLGLESIDVTKAPPAWNLGALGVTGRLSGEARVHATMSPDGVDLSGSSGKAVVTGGTIQGIPVKSLTLIMNAKGGELRYDSTKDASSNAVSPPDPKALMAELLVALQAPDAADQKKPAFQLPKSISTRLELEDVEIAQVVAKAEYLLGFPFPLPVTGKLAMKADATIPLGRLQHLNEYAFHGDLTLTGASIFRVDVGRLSARVDLDGGVLNLTKLRGQLVDSPRGGPDNPPPPTTADVPSDGPIPPGAFRGELHAELDPPGKLSARLEGIDLPLGEIAAPALPRPTPVSGLATFKFDARADLKSATNPDAWAVNGSALSRRIRYGDATLDEVSTAFELMNGRLDVAELTAKLAGRPLTARVKVALKAPYEMTGKLDVSGWDLSRALAWRPGALASYFGGSLTAKAEARGTLAPRAIETEGRGRVDRLKTGPLALGDVPFSWTTKGKDVAVTVTDARPLGGRLDAEATIPLDPGRPFTGSAKLENIDVAAVSVQGLALSGKASGRVDVSVPSDVTALAATVRLTSSDLTVQGVPAEHVLATVKARRGTIDYDLSAQSLGGTVRLKGEVPFGAAPVRPETNGSVQAVNFSVERLLKARGFIGPAAHVSGRGAIDANLRAVLSGEAAGLYARGVAEFRDLHIGAASAPGKIRGEVAVSPKAWRVEPLSGDLLGGSLSGFVWGTPAVENGIRGPTGFDLKLEHTPLKSLLALTPGLPAEADGAGALHIAGTLAESVHANVEYVVPRAHVSGFPLVELRIPCEIVVPPGGSGTVRIRRWTARLAGGRIRGDASFRFGADRSFKTDLILSDIDLETIARSRSKSSRSTTGRISGKVTLAGSDSANPHGYRGNLDLDLDDASLVNMPVFREIDKFLGSARGGLFEHGDLIGTVSNRQINLDPLTLEGRLAQLHITGTVGFDGQLNLAALISTNQVIPQTGQALLALIPGLGSGARNDEATLKVANYLSNKLLKFRITGTADNPSVSLDPSLLVAGPAVGFFAGVLKLPLGFVK